MTLFMRIRHKMLAKYDSVWLIGRDAGGAECGFLYGAIPHGLAATLCDLMAKHGIAVEQAQEVKAERSDEPRPETVATKQQALFSQG